MPLDASLNNDVHTCVDMSTCTTFTHNLKSDDLGSEMRFIRHTAAEQTSTYLRLLDPDLGIEAGMLLGHRVSEGIEKFIPAALKAIRDHRGVTVPNLGTRKGHRAVVVPGKSLARWLAGKGSPVRRHLGSP